MARRKSPPFAKTVLADRPPPREGLRTASATYGRDVATANIEFRRIGREVIGRQSQCCSHANEGWRRGGARRSVMGKKEG